MTLENNYNERLFNNWQSIYHLRRFHWLRKKLKQYGKENSSFLELGCFDARTLQFIPEKQLKHYLGLDENWEQGLDSAKQKFKDNEKVSLIYCSTPEDIPNNKSYDIAISLETFEHIKPELVEPFLKKIASLLNGYLFISIPIERGPSLLIATIIRFINKTSENYHFREWINAFLGRMNKVKRNQHKGFDDKEFIQKVSRHFNIVKTEGIFINTPFESLNLSTGIIAKSKTNQPK